jgi:ribosomal protein S18 acetylase RimI-like enzyme
MDAVSDAPIAIRALTPEDLAAVAAIAAALEGRPRRAYIERRLAAAVRSPKQHAQFAAIDASGLAGYILARVLEGEFGRSETGLRLELVGVRPDVRGHGAGTQLFEALAAWGRRHGARTVRTAAAWNDHAMLRWLDAMGFTLAPNLVIECTTGDGAYRPERDDAISLSASADGAGEVDFGRVEQNDFERLARDCADVRTMTPDDVPGIVRIDHALTGRMRDRYLRGKLDETIADSAIRVSLTARLDGAVAGYLMARADLGDFGRTEPVALIDTIGVDPACHGRGVGHALLSQLFANLSALHVERVETVVAPGDLELTAFLYSAGFRPSQRLAFVRVLD